MVRFATQPSPAFLTANPADIVAQYQLARKILLPAKSILQAQESSGGRRCAGHSGAARVRCRRVRFGEHRRSARARLFRPGHGAGAKSWTRKAFPSSGNDPAIACLCLAAGFASALINPSRSEGWSTTVEEAKSFGVPMILSDIDVHREQTGGTARYFGAEDAGRWRITFARSLAKR